EVTSPERLASPNQVNLASTSSAPVAKPSKLDWIGPAEPICAPSLLITPTAKIVELEFDAASAAAVKLVIPPLPAHRLPVALRPCRAMFDRRSRSAFFVPDVECRRTSLSFTSSRPVHALVPPDSVKLLVTSALAPPDANSAVAF